MTDTRVSQAATLVAGSDTSDLRLSQVVLLVAGRAAETTDEPPDDDTTPGLDVPRAGGGGARISRSPRPDVIWTIDNRHVQMDWDQATMTAPGGYDTMRGRIRAKQMPSWSGQGSHIIARRPTGDILWMGSLVANPKIVDGYAQVEARGPVETIRRRSKRLPYQIRGGQAWTDRESDPFNYPNAERYEMFSKGNSIGWKVADDISYTNTLQAGYAIFLQDWPTRRIAFTIKKTTDMSNFDLVLQVGNDLGSLSDETSWALGAANPSGTTKDYALTTIADTLSLTVRSNTTHTPASVASFWLTELRINGRDFDDLTTTSDIITDLGRRCDYDVARIEGSSLIAVPLDWSGAWDGLADYMAALDDWVWVVEEDRATARGHRGDHFGGMRYSPWGRDGAGEWRGRVGAGLDESVTMLPLYNRVTTYYESPPGLLQSVTTDISDQTDEEFDEPSKPASKAARRLFNDPLERQGVTAEYPQAQMLSDPQANKELATAVNLNTLRRLIRQRVQGSVRVSRLQNGDPLSIRAGDTLDMVDFVPGLPPQRIVGVTYRPDGTSDVQLGHDYALEVLSERHRRVPTTHGGLGRG